MPLVLEVVPRERARWILDYSSLVLRFEHPRATQLRFLDPAATEEGGPWSAFLADAVVDMETRSVSLVEVLPVQQVLI